MPLSHAGAQEHEEYFPQGTTWEEEQFMVTYDEFTAQKRRYTVDGEKIINGKKYIK
ncbi:MAG: hypothetical protein SOZ80_05735 [Prevotella sp.]|uniref:hypothetical protein n=1 Tax=Prevotella sp. TaxID=59823 RepID=UPI002A2CB705|nr:hypothetical protein [Prevotella sp.]MDD7318386.1 hypothetical protein [Prevotellaceae bacterium]MDY4020263.1 hypothetical protein [Prevotella sp.]